LGGDAAVRRSASGVAGTRSQHRAHCCSSAQGLLSTSSDIRRSRQQAAGPGVLQRRGAGDGEHGQSETPVLHSLKGGLRACRAEGLEGEQLCFRCRTACQFKARLRCCAGDAVDVEGAAGGGGVPHQRHRSHFVRPQHKTQGFRPRSGYSTLGGGGVLPLQCWPHLAHNVRNPY